eukprot:scaffold175831_cov42-Attheya_sp.AAC.1
MFVDDTTLLVNAPRPDYSAKKMMRRVQNDISSWCKFLWISGGLLELTKTKYYMMIWNFTSTGKPYLCPEEDLPENIVTVNDQN